MLRTKPRPKTPPGNLFQSSFSRASRNLGAMRVAEAISFTVTSRSSRSRFRRSPNVPLAIRRTVPKFQRQHVDARFWRNTAFLRGGKAPEEMGHTDCPD